MLHTFFLFWIGSFLLLNFLAGVLCVWNSVFDVFLTSSHLRTMIVLIALLSFCFDFLNRGHDIYMSSSLCWHILFLLHWLGHQECHDNDAFSPCFLFYNERLEAFFNVIAVALKLRYCFSFLEFLFIFNKTLNYFWYFQLLNHICILSLNPALSYCIILVHWWISLEEFTLFCFAYVFRVCVCLV